MTHNTTTPVTAAELLKEAQKYHTSLESLMDVGRAMLNSPSLEDSTATAFQILAEGVLEEADHQGDLQVVDGVVEPEARIELIMQDVLTPRLTEIEAIEQSLADKADSEVPVPFTTRDVMTSTESFDRHIEILGMFRENVQLIKAVISLEGMTAEVIRPFVLQIAQRAGVVKDNLGVSMEALGETQVLGDMADAVERIEQLVDKAHEAVTEKADAARSAAEGIGADGQDKMGDLIEQHREENPAGAHLDEGTSVTTVANDQPITAAADETGEVAGEEGAESADTSAADAETTDDAVDDALTLVAPQDETAVEEPVVPPAEEQEGQEEETPDTEEEENKPDEEEEQEEEQEEEEDEDKASTESNADPVVFETLAHRAGDDVGKVKDMMTALLSFLGEHDLLTAEGLEAQAALASGGDGFVLDSTMVKPAVAEVLTTHYETWSLAALRDGEANTRSMAILLGL